LAVGRWDNWSIRFCFYWSVTEVMINEACVCNESRETHTEFWWAKSLADVRWES